MADDLEKLREELQKEYDQLRKRLGKVLEAMSAVERAGPEDDVNGLLERLADAVEEVKDGGLLGSGSNGHKRARDKYLAAKGG